MDVYRWGMALYRFQARFKGVSGLPEDVYENVLYYDVTTAESGIEIVADGIRAAFGANILHGGILGMEVRAYVMPGGGEPVFRKDYAYPLNGGTGPGEVALCLSYASVDDWETSTPRRRGRIFVGPLVLSHIAGPRPGTALIEEITELGQGLAAAGGADAAWHIWSPTDEVSAPIESISIDNSWDTQRRRGLSPTERIVVDV